MPVPAHTLIQYNGRIRNPLGGATLEEWQTSLKAPLVATTENDALNGMAQACRNAFATNFAPLFGDDVELTRTRVIRINALGEYERRADGTYMIGEEGTDHLFSTPRAGNFPLQAACVVSLVSARQGPTGKGRAFLPYPSAFGLNDERRWPTSVTTTIASAAAEWVRDVRAAVGQVAVVSSKGHVSPVVLVRVGNVPDTQRSRRAQAAEGRQAANI